MSMDFLTFFDDFKITGTGKHAHPRTEADDRDAMHRSSLPCRQLNVLRDFVDGESDSFASEDGPTFLWDAQIEDISSRNDLVVIEDSPVAPKDQAHEVMARPIEWYFNGLASVIPTAQRHDIGIEIPNEDMPTYHADSEALAGVRSVVANATASTHWLDAATNLASALGLTAVFLSNVADRNNEGFDFINDLTRTVRIYFDSLARNATPSVAGQALNTLVSSVCNENFMLNPVQMVEILSCTLSYARWDDTRILAFDAIAKADAAVTTFLSTLREHGDQADTNEVDMTEASVLSGLIDHDQTEDLRTHYDHLMLFLRHDLLRLSGDHEAANRVLSDHVGTPPFADVLAARLIHEERWEDLLGFCDTLLAHSPNQQLLLFPMDIAPYGWDSLREGALESLGRREDLRILYRQRIVEAYDADEIFNVHCLKALSADDWPDQVRRIVDEYDDGLDRFTRNMAYEHLLISEHLGEEACRYAENFPKARAKLAKTIAAYQPDTARRIILGPLGLDGSYHDNLPNRREAYRRIVRALTKYASVFTVAEAQQVASRLVERYPSRRLLAEALHAFLE